MRDRLDFAGNDAHWQALCADVCVLMSVTCGSLKSVLLLQEKKCMTVVACKTASTYFL